MYDVISEIVYGKCLVGGCCSCVYDIQLTALLTVVIS